jgi:transposase
MSGSEREELHRLKEENQRLSRLIEGLEQQLKKANEDNAELRKLLKELQEKLDILIVQFKKRNRRDFGSKTERHNPRQGATLAEDQPDTEAPPPTSKPSKQAQPKAAPPDRKKHIRSQNLPTLPVPHKVSSEQAMCPHCAVETKFVRNEVSYQLESLRQSVQRLEHLQEVRSCPKCKQYIVTAEKPCPPIPGSNVGPGLLADIVVDKLADGLPNNRQEKRYRRMEAIIPRSTQSDWMIAIAQTVRPLYELLKTEILRSSIIQTDESELKVQDRKYKGKMRKGKLTVYRGDGRHPYSAFDFSPTQAFARNIEFLGDFVGIVQADAAPGFDAIFRDGTKIEAGCNAHSRRRYYDCLVVEPVLAKNVLDIYDALYRIERRIKNLQPEVRLAIRRRYSKPLTKKLHKTIVKMRDSLTPKHPLLQAIEYTLNHWIALTRFLGHPELEIDNNATERDIKDFVLDRKNFLFAGSNRGGETIAILLTLVSSAKRNGVDPREYLTDVFSRINSIKTSELQTLLPDRWKQNQTKSS